MIESLKLTSSYNSVADIERLIDKVCTSVGVNEDAYGNVLIAVTEAVNNAIQHGNKENETLSINVSVRNNKENVCFSVKDEGQGRGEGWRWQAAALNSRLVPVCVSEGTYPRAS